MALIIKNKKPKPEEDLRYNFAYSSVSAAHTYGNMAAIIANYVKSLFPDNYFKTIHIATKIAYKEFDYKKNSLKEVFKKEKPMLIIKPRININDSDLFMGNTLATTRYTDDFQYGNFSELQPFFEDEDRGIYIKYLLNRLCMEFDVNIITETTMEQINLASYIKNRVRQEKSFELRTSLESNVSKNVMDIISNDSKIPMYDENGSVQRFLKYINSHSFFPVTYKMKNSTSEDEFFRYYNTKVDTEFRGLDIDEGNKKGMVSDTATINFNIRTEFWGTGLYYYFTQNKKNNMGNDLSSIDPEAIIEPLFTIDISLPKPDLPEGFNFYTSALYKVDVETGEDRTEIIPLLNESTSRIFEYCNSKGVPIEPFISFYISKDSQYLEKDKDYYIDYEKMEIVTTNLNVQSTYRIFIFINTLYVNDLIRNMIDNERDFHAEAIDSSMKNDKFDKELPRHFKITENAVKDEEKKIIVRSEKNIVNDIISDVYIGAISAVTPTGNIITSKCEKIQLSSNTQFEYTFHLNKERMIIVIPEDWNNIKHIIDIYGTDIINEFDLEYIVINKKTYKYYISGKDEVSGYLLRAIF